MKLLLGSTSASSYIARHQRKESIYTVFLKVALYREKALPAVTTN